MSFMSKLSSVVKTATPFISMAGNLGVPYVGPIANTLQSLIVKQEATSSAPGAQKFSAVLAEFEAGLGLTNSILATRGEVISYDPELFKATNDAFVNAYNLAARLEASVKIVKKA